jgi:hypothetical protein
MSKKIISREKNESGTNIETYDVTSGRNLVSCELFFPHYFISVTVKPVGSAKSIIWTKKKYIVR